MERDIWIRWTYRCNGWMWSVMEGATLVAEGVAASEAEAQAAAEAA